jgi:predicted nucleic acid-binding protein
MKSMAAIERRFTLDSNVLVYAFDSNSPEKRRVAAEILRMAATLDCVLTLQSLAEFFVVVTRKGKVNVKTATTIVEKWRSLFPIVAASSDTLMQAIDRQARYNLSFWDSMLLATAAQAGCSLVVSEDMTDGQRVDGVLILSPFTADDNLPVELLKILESGHDQQI